MKCLAGNSLPESRKCFALKLITARSQSLLSKKSSTRWWIQITHAGKNGQKIWKTKWNRKGSQQHPSSTHTIHHALVMPSATITTKNPSTHAQLLQKITGAMGRWADQGAYFLFIFIQTPFVVPQRGGIGNRNRILNFLSFSNGEIIGII